MSKESIPQRIAKIHEQILELNKQLNHLWKEEQQAAYGYDIKKQESPLEMIPERKPQ